MDHPSDSQLDHFLQGELPAEETQALVVHFLRGCSHCVNRLLDPPHALQHEEESGLPLPIPESPPAALWLELAALAPPQRLLALQKRRYRSPALAVWLTCLSRDQAPADPALALELAELALAVVDQLSLRSVLAQDLLSHLRATALAHVGNARRCLGLFPASLRAFLEAETAMAQAIPDPLQAADFHSLRSSLLKDLGRFEEAAQDLREAYRLAQDVAEPHSLGRICLKLGDLVGLSNSLQGLELLEEAERLIDFRREPMLRLALLHRRAWFLNDAGKSSQALEVFLEASPLYTASLVVRLRAMRSWLRGRIERSFGDCEQAAVYISRAVSLFYEIGAAHDHAVSSLDLADVYLRLGQAEAASQLLASSVPFLEGHLHAEGLTRWLALTAVAGRLTPELLAEASRYFRSFWHAPTTPGT
jgi:tetratricopeptide (TPR) repeat protein